jgi:hypothetical protein
MPYTSPSTTNLPRAARIAGAVRLADVVPTGIRWLWPGRIPLGRVTLLVSDPGLGKSLLTLDIAARVSRAAPWPDQCSPLAPREENRLAERDDYTLPSAFPLPPSSVLLLTAEDDLADTIRPRLEALGADCQKILAVNTWSSFAETAKNESRRDSSTCVPRAFALNRDLARLKNLLDAIADCRLIIIDPISAYLGGTNEHANADIQSLLTALAALARERELAVLVVSHLRKKEGAAIYRTMGSLAFVAAARAVWVLCKDPADANRRFFLPIKNNLAPDVAGLAYSIGASGDHRTPVIRWSPEPVHFTTETLPAARPRGRPDDERQFAIDWLQRQLAETPLPTRKLKEDAAAFGISYGTLRRAFRSLDGEAIQSGWPFKSWHWKLPGTLAQKYEGEFCAPDFLHQELTDFLKSWRPPPINTQHQ